MDAPTHRSRRRSPEYAPRSPASRSRSPRRRASRHRHRSPSPSHPRSHHHHHRRHHRGHRDDKKRTRSPSPGPITLPFNAPPLTKHALSLPHIRAVFATYLDVQKDLVLDTLDTREAKGRFKRFVSHYNRGELARGWYERVNQPGAVAPEVEEKQRVEEEEESEEEVVGPFLPGQEPGKRRKVGPKVPTAEDLDMQREILADDADLARADLRFHRSADRKSQREALDELVPRAAAGTHERRLEKKKEVNEKMRSFREKSAEVELDDSTLMGGAEGGTEGFKQKKAALERKKNDRELRKEQLLRARIAEREERLQMHRVKEERTMAMLKTLATRFQ